MNIIITLFVLFWLAALIPLITVGLALLLIGGCFIIWVLPILIIASSEKTTGGEKLAWILAIIFLSWFAWVFYFLLAPIKPRRRYSYY